MWYSYGFKDDVLMPNRFCAICGIALVDDSPHFGMCLKCYLKENPLFELPNKFSLNICFDCGNYAKKEVWIEPLESGIFSKIKEALQKYLLKPIIIKDKLEFSISFNEESFVFSSKEFLVSLEAKINGFVKTNFNIKHQQVIRLNLIYILCKNCSNLRGGTYFVSILQLRVKGENQFDLIKKVLDEINDYGEILFEKDHKHYISKIEDQKYGVDLYLSTKEVMNYIIKFLKSNYYFLIKRTKKLVGRDKQGGRNIYRLKTLIKFLPIANNDIVLIDNQNHMVEKITKNRVILRSENNNKLIKAYSYFFKSKYRD